MRKNTVFFLFFAFFEISVYAQWDDYPRKAFDTNKFALAQHYSDVNNWDIFVESVQDVYIADTVFDEFGLKNAYFVQVYYWLAFPKHSPFKDNPPIHSGSWLSWKKLPVEGNDLDFFVSLRNAIFPYASNFPKEESTEEIVKKYYVHILPEHLDSVLVQFKSQIKADSSNFYYYYELDSEGNPYKYEYDISSYYNDEKISEKMIRYSPDFKTYFDLLKSNTQHCKLYDNFFLVDNYSLPLFIGRLRNYNGHYDPGDDYYYRYDGIEINDILPKQNNDYLMLDQNIICSYHHIYDFHDEAGYSEDRFRIGGGFLASTIDSIMVMQEGTFQKINCEGIVKDSSNSIFLIHPRGIVIQSKSDDMIRLVVTTEKDTILHYLNPSSQLYSYYWTKEVDNATPIFTYNLFPNKDEYWVADFASGIIVHYEAGLYDFPDFDFFNREPQPIFEDDHPMSIDTLILPEQQQKQIRKELLKLARLDAQLDQIKIQSESYYMFRYNDSGEYFVKKQQNLYAYDEESGRSVVAPEYRKKVGKIIGEKEKIANKLKKMGVSVYYYDPFY